MAFKDLLVNARTKILEFKKKHNLLVEKVEEIPNVEDASSGEITSILGLDNSGKLKKESANTVIEDGLVGVQSGELVSVLGINSDGELCKGTISGGTKLYKHQITFNSGAPLIIYSTSSTQFTSLAQVINNFNKADIISAELQTYGKVLTIFADTADDYKEKALVLKTGAFALSEGIYNAVSLSTFVGDTVSEL